MATSKFPGLFALLLAVSVLPQAALTQVFTPSSVVLIALPKPTTLGAPVTLTASVTPPQATGKVTFFDDVTILGTSTIFNGSASFTTYQLPAGTRRLSAYYSGDGTFFPSTGNTTLTVNTVGSVGFRATGLANLGPNVPSSLVVGDFNHDGKSDFAVNYTASPNVTILLGNGDGSFQTPVNYVVGFSSVYMIAGDFNNDSNTDIAVTIPDSGQGHGILSVLLGNGDGTFRSALSVPAPFGPLASADFNRDGKADLVILGVGGDGVNILIGNGDGTFRTPAIKPPVNVAGSFLAVGDFNGDSRPDIITGDGTTALRFYPGNGDGTVQAPLGVGSIVPFSTSLTAADFNNDGKLDLLVGATDNQVVLKGNGDGSFQPPIIYNIHGVPATGDFNGDGIVDLAIASNFPTTAVQVLQGNGDGSFHLSVNYTTANSPFALAVTDFNGDGRADVVALNTSVAFPLQGTATILLGVPPGVSLTPTAGTPQSGLVGTPFGTPLQVTLVQDGAPVNGAVITFNAPGNGPSALLSSGTAVTNTAGIATVNATANGVTGNYQVTAIYQQLSATFNLSNSTLANVTATGGTPQSALVNTPFAKALQVTVKDSVGNPASGALVTFTAPTTGASASVTHLAQTDAAGIASVAAVANGVGGNYLITATVGSVATAFSLTNVTLANITPLTGTPQSTVVGTSFHTALSVTLKDSMGNPVPNYKVNFSSPTTGPSTQATLITAFTDGTGVATVSEIANALPGVYLVTATTEGADPTILSTTFSLTNLPIGGGNPNLAVNKPATQSSTLAGAPTAVAASAVDDKTDGNFANGSVTATNSEASPWWQVDLGFNAVIDSIGIWSRTDCCNSGLHDYWVFASTTPFLPTDTPATLANRAGTFASHQTTTPNPFTNVIVGGLQARYIRVQVTGTDSLSLAEVQVFGVSATAGPKLQAGVFRNGAWFVDWNGNNQWDATDAAHVLSFGLPGDIAVVNDWNGDGKLKLGVFRNGFWYVDWNGNNQWDSTDAAHILAFGLPGDLPVLGDWNGDGKMKLGVYRNGAWFVDWNGNNQWDDTDAAHIFFFGLPGDVPIMGDWNGNGKLKPGVYRSGSWYVDFNGNNQWDSTDAANTFQFGMPGDIPVAADWNSDGRVKAGVFRNGAWFVDWNGNNQSDPIDDAHFFVLGLPGDQPVLGRWDPSQQAAIAFGRAVTESMSAPMARSLQPDETALRTAAQKMEQDRNTILMSPEMLRRLSEMQKSFAAIESRPDVQEKLHRMQREMQRARDQQEK